MSEMSFSHRVAFPFSSLSPISVLPAHGADTPVQSWCTTGSSSFVFSGGKETVKNPARARPPTTSVIRLFRSSYPIRF